MRSRVPPPPFEGKEGKKRTPPPPSYLLLWCHASQTRVKYFFGGEGPEMLLNLILLALEPPLYNAGY